MSTVGIVSGRGVFIAPADGTGEWRDIGYTLDEGGFTAQFQPELCDDDPVLPADGLRTLTCTMKLTPRQVGAFYFTHRVPGPVVFEGPDAGEKLAGWLLAAHGIPLKEETA